MIVRQSRFQIYLLSVRVVLEKIVYLCGKTVAAVRF